MGAACGTPFAETAKGVPLSTMFGALVSRVLITQDTSRCAGSRCCALAEAEREHAATKEALDAEQAAHTETTEAVAAAKAAHSEAVAAAEVAQATATGEHEAAAAAHELGSHAQSSE